MHDELGRLHLEEVFPEKVETSCYIGDVEQAAVDGNCKVIFHDHTLLMTTESLKFTKNIQEGTDT